MGTVIDLDDRAPWPLPPPKLPPQSLLPPALDSRAKRDRVQLAHLQMLDRATALMSAIDDLTRKGFVPLGFTAHIEDGMTVMVETPADGLVDRRKDLAVTAVRGTNYVWFLYGDVRVAWQFTVPEDAA